jgi:two-component system chemotaxis sensor kinase CheA
MGPHEIISLVFAPGFSTAETVTNVSGRGVGMDVVRTNIEKIGGTVDIQSSLGQGTTVRMKIPLTLAIIPVLIVRSSGQRFAIPQVSLLELLRLEAGRNDQSIEMVHGSPVYRLRGNLLPLLFLSRELQQQPADASAREQQLSIVVLQAEGQQFGLVVDEIHDAEEIVVKPVGKHLKHISAFSGATVMGDGEVALILDVVGLAKGGRLLTEAKKASLQEASTSQKAETQTAANKQELLLFRTAGGRRTAVQLSSVDRLEEFKVDQFERAGQKTVVQYRGELLPIVNLSDRFEAARASRDEHELLKVLVCRHNGQRMGVVVDQILDVAQEAVAVEERWKDSQSQGSAVIQKHVTDFLNLNAMLDAARGDELVYDFQTPEAVL